ncbi:gamma-glutamyl hydrolase 1-like [Salvia splendens]|uniref:gamma-glutamyl hydrolase 1-like n=1 Tax=Salvia splendens TaxID=180675 RepID=UPI001C260DA7|nr:gamma-glutamyl hydrolase 1-like [Salvia splendens]
MPQKLSLVNGVIFTGGVANRPPYIDVVKKIYKEILRMNDDDDGHHVPLLAICLGFQLLIAIVNVEHSMKLERFDAEKHPWTLQLENIDFSGTVLTRCGSNTSILTMLNSMPHVNQILQQYFQL